MYKASLVALAGTLIVVVLSFLIIESRTVKDDYYVAQADRSRTLEAIAADIAAATEAAESAFTAGHAISPSVNAELVQLSRNNERLQSLADFPRGGDDIGALFTQFGDELHQFIANGQTFIEKQNAMTSALLTLQDEAPIFVRELREGGLLAQSQLVFVLAVDLIEFATEPTRDRAPQLYSRLENTGIDLDFQRTEQVLQTAKTIVDQHTAAEMTLIAMRENRSTALMVNLTDAISLANNETVQRAELARSLLAVSAFLLLLGAAFALVRLQSSYRELNKSNAELELANNQLEGRVTARTEQLSKTNEELRESQSQLIHAEKMSSLGQMVAGISHEINTPLWYLMNNSSVLQERLEVIGELCGIAKTMTTAVQTQTDVRTSIQTGLTDLHGLLKDGIEDDIEEAKSLIEDSIFGLEELTTLAQGLKDFSRLDRAIQGQFNINEGLDKALLIASNKIKNRVEIHKYYGDVPSVHCSPSQINQIFLNLLTNAADAIEERGDIVIQTWEEQGSVGISIADSGAGIPEDVLPNIRNPFFTTKEVGKGTGLGLSIVDQIVTKHSGELRIDSEPGKGTCVTVILPVAESAENAAKLEHEENDTQLIDVATRVAARKTDQIAETTPELLSA